METEDKHEKKRFSGSDSEEAITNDGIVYTPYETPFVCEAVAVGYGPDPMLIGDISSIGDDDVIFTNVDDAVVADIDSNMYGGPWPEDYLLEEINLSDLCVDTESLLVDDIDSGNETGDANNKQDDISNYIV